jgi:hypothetical protein
VTPARSDSLLYSNITNFTGFAVENGGAANVGGDNITTLLADDITPGAGLAGGTVDSFFFSVANFNAVAVSARPLVRFYNANGAGSEGGRREAEGCDERAGAALAQLNGLGEGIFSPPTLGSSQDVFFATNNAGSFAGNNPAGGLFNFGGNPPANFAWAFSGTPVPEPSALLQGTVACLLLIGVAWGRSVPRARDRDS